MKIYAIVSLALALVILVGLIILAIIAVRSYRQMRAKIAELEAAVERYEAMIYGVGAIGKTNNRRR